MSPLEVATPPSTGVVRRGATLLQRFDNVKRRRLRRPFEQTAQSSAVKNKSYTFESSALERCALTPPLVHSSSPVLSQQPSLSLSPPVVVASTLTLNLERPQRQGPFLSLPRDVFVLILSYLTSADIIAHIEPCCFQCFLNARDDYLWAQLCRRDFPNTAEGRHDSVVPWRHVYRCRADKEKINKYKNEPSNIRELYLEMETALACFQEPSTPRKQDFTLDPLFARWTIEHPQRPRPVLESDDTNVHHICRPDACSFERLAEGVFLCVTTSTSCARVPTHASGIVHVCFHHHPCSKVVLADSTLVCPISGRVITPTPTDWRRLKRRRVQDVYDTFMGQASLSQGDYPSTHYDHAARHVSKQHEDDEWAVGGFFGRCFARGYDCVNEEEFGDFLEDYF